MQGSFRSIVGLISSLYYVFARQPRFLSSLQLLVYKELFHQSSFYMRNSVSSVQLLFKKSYVHLFVESPGENVIDPQNAQRHGYDDITIKVLAVPNYADKLNTKSADVHEIPMTSYIQWVHKTCRPICQSYYRPNN